MDLDREEEVAEEPGTWSVSRLETIQTCGRKYKFRYVEHVPAEKTVALKFGSLVHQFIDDIHKEGFEDVGELQEKWLTEWGAASRTLDWSSELMSSTQYKNRGKSMLEKYWRDHRNDVIVASEIKFVHEPRTTELPRLQGIIDKIQELAPGVLGVVDFKTSKYPPDPVVLRRDLQLTTYYTAAQSLGYDVNFFAIHHLLSGEVHWTWRDNEDTEIMQEGFHEGMRKVRSQMFARNIGFQCKWCSYKEKCLRVGGSTT